MTKGSIVRVKRALAAQLALMPGAGVIVSTTVDRNHIVQFRVVPLVREANGKTVLFNASQLEPFRGALTVAKGAVEAVEDHDDRDEVDLHAVPPILRLP